MDSAKEMEKFQDDLQLKKYLKKLSNKFSKHIMLSHTKNGENWLPSGNTHKDFYFNEKLSESKGYSGSICFRG